MRRLARFTVTATVVLTAHSGPARPTTRPVGLFYVYYTRDVNPGNPDVAD